jgi:hypothetical protein
MVVCGGRYSFGSVQGNLFRFNCGDSTSSCACVLHYCSYAALRRLQNSYFATLSDSTWKNSTISSILSAATLTVVQTVWSPSGRNRCR